MSMSDPIADFLTRIRNATMRKHADLESPGNRLKIEVARVLKQEGFVRDYNGFNTEKGMKRIGVELKYDKKGASVIRGIQRISKPGLRKYVGYKDLDTVLNGQGIAIVSTSQGVFTDAECREKKIGGEVLCHVW